MNAKQNLTLHFTCLKKKKKKSTNLTKTLMLLQIFFKAEVSPALLVLKEKNQCCRETLSWPEKTQCLSI